jgi:hypothetical protein
MMEKGGPRFWCALTRRMSRLGWIRRSLRARPISGTFSDAAGITRTASEPPWESTTRGYIGHLAFPLKPAADFEAPPPIDIEQWCLPSRRQQGGRFASDAEPKTGLNSERLRSTSNRMAEKRRKRLCYLILANASERRSAMSIAGFQSTPELVDTTTKTHPSAAQLEAGEVGPLGTDPGASPNGSKKSD